LTLLQGGKQVSFATLIGQMYTIKENSYLLSGWIPWPGVVSILGNRLTNTLNLDKLGAKFSCVRLEQFLLVSP